MDVERKSILVMMKSYIADIGRTNPTDVEFLLDFIEKMEFDDDSIFRKTPQEVGLLEKGLEELRSPVFSYIKALPFEKKPKAIEQFDDLFEKGSRREFDFSKIYGSSNKTNRFCLIEKLYEQNEWKILLLKRLQMGQAEYLIGPKTRKTRQQVADDFGITYPTLREKCNELRGTDLLGSTIAIDLPDRKATYDNTVHPVFLALNLAEVNFLTTVLRERFKDDPLNNMAADIAYDIYRQLSDYGKMMIDKNAKKYNIDFEKGYKYYDPTTKMEIEHRPTKGYRQDIGNVFGLLEKRECYCEIIIGTEMDKPMKGWVFRDIKDKDYYTFTDIKGNKAKFHAWDIKYIKFLSEKLRKKTRF